MPDQTISRIFVYGSLRKAFDHPKHNLLHENGELLSMGTCPGKLYQINWYPGVVQFHDSSDRVTGEVYNIYQNLETVLKALDQYEGCSPEFPEPHLFVRRIETITLDYGGTTKAWIYHYNRDPDGETLIPSGDFLKWKGF